MARRHRSRRGLSGIWSGVLVILILLLTSSFIFVALNYVDQATTTAINTVKRAGESCSIARSITGYWKYDPVSGNITINITNFYLESITIVSISFIVNNTGNIQHVVIDRYNASNYGLKLPISIPPGGKINLTITLPGKPIITSIGIWGSGLVSLVIPPGNGLIATQSIILPEATSFNVSLRLVSDNSIFYTDMDTLPNGWQASLGTWNISQDSGYWGTGDNALLTSLRGRNAAAEYDWLYDLSGHNRFYFYTKLKFNRVNPNYYSGVYLYSNSNYFFQQLYFITLSRDTLNIELYIYVPFWGWIFIDDNPVPITLTANSWYSLEIKYDAYTDVVAQVYDSTSGSLVGETSLTVLIPGSTINQLGLLAWGGTFDLYFDEILVSTRDIYNVTFQGTQNGWTITIGKNSNVIGRSTAQNTVTNVTVIKDAVTAVDGYSNVCVELSTGSACITSNVPILGGNIYEIKLVSGSNVALRNRVSVSSSSR